VGWTAAAITDADSWIAVVVCISVVVHPWIIQLPVDTDNERPVHADSLIGVVVCISVVVHPWIIQLPVDTDNKRPVH
jgi:hypothetical protein